MSPSDHTLYDEQSNDVGVEIHSDIEDPCVDSAESSDTVLYTPPRANDVRTSQNRDTASHDDITTSHNNDTPRRPITTIYETACHAMMGIDI